jgi:hypothetical protein
VRVIGDADTARLSDSLKASCDVDTITENIVVVDDDVADMNADPKFDPDILRDVGILPGHAALDFDCAPCGVYGASELHEHAIASSLNDAAAMRGDCGIEKRLSERLQTSERAFFVAAHQTAIAGDIRRQHSRQPPFHALVGQNGPLDRGNSPTYQSIGGDHSASRNGWRMDRLSSPIQNCE